MSEPLHISEVLGELVGRGFADPLPLSSMCDCPGCDCARCVTGRRCSIGPSRTDRSTAALAASTGPYEAGGEAATLSSNQISPPLPTVTWATGGNFCKVSVPTGGGSSPGIRAAVGDFSARSRLAMLRALSCVNRQIVTADCVGLLTLTYSGKSFPDPKGAKEDLDTFTKRLKRLSPGISAFWRLEPQKRGAPHFHLLLFKPLIMAWLGAGSLHEWCVNAWHEIAGKGDNNHRLFHLGELRNSRPCLEPIRDWNGVMSYAGSYIGKKGESWDQLSEAHPDWKRPGKWWGIFNRKGLPIQMQKIVVSARVAVILRRALVRFYEHQPSGKYRLENYSEVDSWVIQSAVQPGSAVM